MSIILTELVKEVLLNHHSWIFYLRMILVHESRAEVSTLNKAQMSTCWVATMQNSQNMAHWSMVELIFVMIMISAGLTWWGNNQRRNHSSINGYWDLSKHHLDICLFTCTNQSMETEIELTIALRGSPKWLQFYLKRAWKCVPNLMEISPLVEWSETFDSKP